MDIDAKVCLVLNVCFEVRHLKVIVYPVHNEVGEPRGLARGLEQLVEELQAFLTEVVTEYFKTHECWVMEETLRNKCQPEVINAVIS